MFFLFEKSITCRTDSIVNKNTIRMAIFVTNIHNEEIKRRKSKAISDTKESKILKNSFKHDIKPGIFCTKATINPTER